MNRSDCQHIGTLIKLYGYKGAFIVALNTYLGSEIEKWESVFIEVDGLLVPFFIDNIELTGDTTAQVTFDDLNSETLAKKFLNCEVFQLKTLVKPKVIEVPDELKGYQVIDNKAGSIGIVDEVLNFKQNYLLKVLNGKKEILIPIAENIIVKVNHKKKEILISAPEGLFDLNN